MAAGIEVRVILGLQIYIGASIKCPVPIFLQACVQPHTDESHGFSKERNRPYHDF